MPDLRTLLFTHSFPPSVGGVQSFYYNIAKYYPNNNIVVFTDIISGSENFDKSQDYLIYRKAIGEMKNKASIAVISNVIRCVLYLFPVMKREKIEHIIVGQCHNVAYVAASIMLGKFFRVPVTLFAHGEDVAMVLKADLRSKPILTFLYKLSNYFIANSKFTKETWVKLGCPPKKIHILNPCVNSVFFHPLANVGQLRKKYNLSKNKVLLTVGRLDKRKSHDMVITSLSILREKFPNIVYVIVGDGEERKNLEDLSRKCKEEKNVFFWGKVTREHLREAFNICDVFVMPNKEVGHGDLEGFGMVFLEANSCGKAVIGGRSGGTEDAIMVGRTGFLCAPDDPDDFVEKVSILLSDEKMAENFGKEGRERALSLFDWQKKIPLFFSDFPANPQAKKALGGKPFL